MCTSIFLPDESGEPGQRSIHTADSAVQAPVLYCARALVHGCRSRGAVVDALASLSNMKNGRQKGLRSLRPVIPDRRLYGAERNKTK